MVYLYRALVLFIFVCLFKIKLCVCFYKLYTDKSLANSRRFWDVDWKRQICIVRFSSNVHICMLFQRFPSLYRVFVITFHLLNLFLRSTSFVVLVSSYVSPFVVYWGFLFLLEKKNLSSSWYLNNYSWEIFGLHTKYCLSNRVFNIERMSCCKEAHSLMVCSCMLQLGMLTCIYKLYIYK